ncbi:hypothetical protein HIR71_09930 [Cellulomonas fimi]|uniref:ATP-grasp domain-containing protein n=2 Tax=Cellulomonas fimi TaxID=1708 RepID=A0A7Y0LYP4_CELFI|nr:hypothetical protein [Cellulomonas fimi]
MRRRLAGQEPFTPARIGDKKKLRQFAGFVGVRVPETFYVGPIADLLERDLPEEFALKPDFASTSIGVLLLKRASAGSFINLLDGQEISGEEVLSRCGAISERYYGDAARGHFIAEELLRDHEGRTPPQDIRFYTFQGEIGMILKEEHLAGPASAMYFDGEFLPFPDVTGRYGVAKSAEHLEAIVPATTPENWRELLAVAKRVSTAVASSFCRVDLYDTPAGIYLGEITFFPGTFYYRDRKLMSQAEAERLGRMWDAAAERLRGSKDQPSAPSNETHADFTRT